MKTCLVTGANGFIAQALISELFLLGYQVTALSRDDGDISSATTWENISIAADYVFHLAGSSFVPDSWVHPDVFMQTNIIGSELALEYCRKNNSKLIFVSSYVYGAPVSLPIKEIDRAQPNNPYALSKHIAEQLCKFYYDNWGVNVTVVRPFNIYGCGQKDAFLIPEVLKQIFSNKTNIAVNSLQPRRDYLYIDDFVSALIKIVELCNGFNLINIGSGISYSVAEVIEFIQLVAGTSLPVYEKSIARINEIDNVYADIEHAGRVLGWRPAYTFFDGITKMVGSYSSR